MSAGKLSAEEEAARLYEMSAFEREYRQKGFCAIAGVDEAGRGPLAGPVYAAAVILKDDAMIPGLNDSKKLSEKKREELYKQITAAAVSYAVASVDERVIDEINILNATLTAMKKSVDLLGERPDFIFIDGNRGCEMAAPYITIIKGDAKSVSVAAASILAKVSRDHYMRGLAEKYPQYGFEKHKGYGTKAHIEAILKYGPCPAHRKTFLKKILENAK